MNKQIIKEYDENQANKKDEPKKETDKKSKEVKSDKEKVEEMIKAESEKKKLKSKDLATEGLEILEKIRNEKLPKSANKQKDDAEGEKKDKKVWSE